MKKYYYKILLSCLIIIGSESINSASSSSSNDKIEDAWQVATSGTMSVSLCSDKIMTTKGHFSRRNYPPYNGWAIQDDANYNSQLPIIALYFDKSIVCQIGTTDNLNRPNITNSLTLRLWENISKYSKNVEEEDNTTSDHYYLELNYDKVNFNAKKKNEVSVPVTLFYYGTPSHHPASIEDILKVLDRNYQMKDK